MTTQEQLHQEAEARRGQVWCLSVSVVMAMKRSAASRGTQQHGESTARQLAKHCLRFSPPQMHLRVRLAAQ